jgi:hypothetical protein
MHFAVESWTRHGQHFDLDNLVTPVMGAIFGKKETNRPEARMTLAGWRATIGQAPTPFLLLDFSDDVLLATEQTCDCRVLIDATWTGAIPTDSGPSDCGLPVWVIANMGDHVPSDDQRFGVHLIFGAMTRSISRPEEKPIKPVIDCLYPIFGGKPRGGQDWKKCLLQVERRDDLQGSCHIRCWLLNKAIQP